MGGRPNPVYDLSPPPIEIPAPTPVGPRPEPNQMAPASGTGHAGQFANIASNFLHGMLAGKDVHERKMQQTAQFSITSAWQTYQQLQATASDPSAPEDARKQATANLGKAYQVWIDNVERYTQPGGQPKKKGVKGVLSRMGGNLTAQKPQFGTEEMLQLYKSPQILQMMSQPHGPSPEQQQQQLQLQREKKTNEQMDQVDSVNKQLTGLLSNGVKTDEDREKAANLLAQQQALTGNLKEIPDPRATQLKREAENATLKLQSTMATDGMAAYEKKQRNQPLSPTEERVLSVYLPEGKTDPFTIYQNMIGKRATNKLTGRPVDVKDDRDALDLYLADQAYWNKVGQKPTAYEEQNADLKKNIKLALQKELGREPTEQEAAQKWMDITYPTKSGEKPRQIPTPEKAQIEQSIYNDLSSNKRWREFIEPGAGKSSLRIKARSAVNKDDQKEYDNMLQHVGSQLADRGFSAEDIREVTGSTGFGMSPTPPSMNGGKPGPKGVGATKKFTITDGKQSTQEEMTQEEADDFKKKYPHYKIEAATAGGL